MQNVQSADIQRVMNLVDLYRRKVGWESETAKEAKAEQDFWLHETLDMMSEMDANGEDYGMGFGLSGGGPHKEVWIKKLMVNEQLLGHFYAEVAGENADKDVLSELLPEMYDKTIFTEEEESFLTSHFKEMVNYIIVTPNDESLTLVDRHDDRDALVIPNEVLELIGSRTKIRKGSKIFYPNTGFAQLVNLYDGCKFLCDENNAWMRVLAFANNVDVDIVEDGFLPESYDAVISYIPKVLISGYNTIIPTSYHLKKNRQIELLCKAFDNLHFGGKFILLCPPKVLVDGTDATLRKMLIETCSIKEIIQLPQVMSNNASFDTYCIIIAEKGRKEQRTTFIDARFAQKDLDNIHYMLSFDIEAFKTIMQNNGVDPRSDRRAVISISSKSLKENMLLPQAFVIERPLTNDHPIPFDSVCTLETTIVRSLRMSLPMDTPWIKETDLSFFYKGELNVTDLEKADCPNNPPHTEEYVFDDEGEFADGIFSQITSIGERVRDYRLCTYIDGKSDVVLYKRTPEDGVCTALLRATGNPVVINRGISVFCPKNGFDALSLLALLRMPIVYMQILAYQDYGLQKFMNEILVPTDKKVISIETYRINKEQSVLKKQQDRYSIMKTEYINEVRMRKHDMRPHMKQLNSAKNLMQHYVDNMDKIDDVKQHLNHQLARFRDALGHLSDLIEHLSDEEKFGESERFSLIDYFKELISESNNDIYIDFDDVAIENYIKKKIYEYSDYMKEQAKLIAKGLPKGEMPKARDLSYVMIAPLDFDRMVQNILENARKHGFTDSTRSDYMIWIMISVDEKRNMYVIDFKNNGTPLPEGMTKERYGIKGEKAGLNGGTGSGGYIVKSIVTHYGGDYDVFYNDENQLTTVRVYLPIATI